MKLTFTLLVIAFLQVSAKTFAQKVTLNEHDASLVTVFNKIRAQTGYDFLVSTSMLQSAKPVNIDVVNGELRLVLKQIFDKQSLNFIIDDKSVVVSKKISTVALSPSFPNKGDRSSLKSESTSANAITGRILNEVGSPLNGATVAIKKSDKITRTDANGIFLIKLAEETDTLVVSYIGYQTRQVPVKNQAVFEIRLSETDNKLDEVVVQAYGETTQRLTTGNIGRVSGAEIAKQPVLDPLVALQGRVAGVVVTPVNGYIGGPVKVEIRGRNSINPLLPSDPLYVIDGVPQTTLDLHMFDRGISFLNPPTSKGLDIAGMSYSEGQSPLLGLNSADIASVEVLKDADATALYGSRGGNGVILITTKKGKPSSGNVSVSVSQGINYAGNDWDLLNTEQYLAMRREAFANDKVIPTAESAPDLLLYDQKRDFDWQKYQYGNKGKYLNLQTELSGGNDLTTYRISGGYNSSKDITTFTGLNARGSVASNITTRSVNDKFNLSLNSSYSSTELNQVAIPGGVFLPPNSPPLFDKNGKQNFLEWHQVQANYPSPGSLNPYESTSNTLNASLNMAYNFKKGFAARLNIGYNEGLSNQNTFSKLEGIDTIASKNNTASNSFARGKTTNIIVEPQINYTGVIGKGTLSLLLGGTYQANTTSYIQVDGSGYPTDDLLESIEFAPILKASSRFGQYKYAGVFSRINYNWDNKYILNLNGRRDGSSRFGTNNRFGNFGSVGLAYLISEEKWMKESLPKFISFVKIRGSYGITGSDGVGDYQYLTQYAANTQATPPYNGVSSLIPLLHANDQFHWEVNKNLEAALSLGLLEDKINLEVAYYRKRTNNQLVAFPLGNFTGFPSVTANSPANVQNSGLEFALNAAIVQNTTFSYNTSFNISFNTNKLLAYPDLEHSPYFTQYAVGKSLSLVHLYQFTGIDPQTGKSTFLDVNHDGKIAEDDSGYPGTGTDDRVVALDLNPKFTGGMSHNIRYKSFYFSMNFSFFKGVKATPFTFANFGSLGNISLYQYENRWKKPGDQSRFPRLTTIPDLTDLNYTISTAGYNKGSYIKLSTVTFAYQFTPAWVKKIGLRSLSLNASGQNLFAVSSFPGLDPEATVGVPPIRTVTCGLTGGF